MEILIEQYKLYVDMADKISQRRNQTNRFYLTMLSGILALIGILQENDTTFSNLDKLYVFISVFAIFISIVWLININSYRKLNTAKFDVIHKMEEKLPMPLYKMEWEYLRGNQMKNKYFQLTKVESLIPIIFMLIFIAIIIAIMF